MVSFSDVKARVSLEDTVRRLGLILVEHNGALRGACPACNAGGSRALVVTPGKGAFCFHAKKGGDQIWLASHIKVIDVKSAAEFLNGTEAPAETAKETPPGGLRPLDHIQHTHEKVQELISPETAVLLGVGYTGKGIMRGLVAVPCYDQFGVLQAYLGLDKPYRYPTNFNPSLHIFNAHRVTDDEVQILPTVEDVLRAYDQGVTAICFLTAMVSGDQLKVLGDWLIETKRSLIL